MPPRVDGMRQVSSFSLGFISWALVTSGSPTNPIDILQEIIQILKKLQANVVATESLIKVGYPSLGMLTSQIRI